MNAMLICIHSWNTVHWTARTGNSTKHEICDKTVEYFHHKKEHACCNIHPQKYPTRLQRWRSQNNWKCSCANTAKFLCTYTW